MERKNRGYLNIIGALAAGYFAYAGQNQYSLYVLALLLLLSGWHHVSGKK